MLILTSFSYNVCWIRERWETGQLGELFKMKLDSLREGGDKVKSPEDINIQCTWNMGFPGSSDSRASAYSAGDLGSIPGSGRSPGEGNGNPLHYSCLENPMDRGAWWATIHGVAKSQTWLRDFCVCVCVCVCVCTWNIFKKCRDGERKETSKEGKKWAEEWRGGRERRRKETRLNKQPSWLWKFFQLFGFFTMNDMISL